jgi:ClpP class serine protease
MAADEILMEAASALGPIDAQIVWQGKVFSAQALLEGMEKIKEDVVRTGSLNRAYVPILQNISPGELQGAQNAYDFARDLVRDWLVRYKFKDWTVHEGSGQVVTPEQRADRARSIADALRDHGKWKTREVEDARPFHQDRGSASNEAEDYRLF